VINEAVTFSTIPCHVPHPSTSVRYLNSLQTKFELYRFSRWSDLKLDSS